MINVLTQIMNGSLHTGLKSDTGLGESLSTIKSIHPLQEQQDIQQSTSYYLQELFCIRNEKYYLSENYPNANLKVLTVNVLVCSYLSVQ